MKKVKVIKIENKYMHTLEDTDKNIYVRCLEFNGVKVVEGDYIYIDESILKEENIYVFGPIVEKNVIEDLIKIVHEGKEIYLQRYYG